jgi:DNA-directed RNA polymerase specialized sigma24 family protein
MNRNEIISKLYESKEIASALRKMQPAQLREELRQEMFISLCQLSDEKFWGIFNNNGVAGLKFWLVRCMLNMIYSTSINQPFYRNFRMKWEILDGFENVSDNFNSNHDYKEVLFNQIEDNRKLLSWYENEMLNTYIDLGFNQTEISRQTKIPYQSIVKTIQIIKKKLREQ